MKKTKEELFDDPSILTASLAKALCHPARIAILQKLAEEETCICGQIVEVLPLAQSTVSQHLKELRRAGLITGEIDGPRSCYCLDRERIAEARILFEKLFDSLEGKNTNTCSCRTKP